MPPRRLPAMIRDRALAAVTAMILVAGCGTPTPSPVDISGAWKLTGGTVDGAPFPLVEDAPVTLSVRGTSISGRSACNHYGGEMVMEGGGCEMRADRDDRDGLRRARDGRRGGLRRGAAEGPRCDARRRSTGAEGARRRAVVRAPGASTGGRMVGTDWVLESLLSTDVVVSVAGDPASLRFEPTGSFHGSTGCRTFGGKWVPVHGGITTTELAMDQTECLPELAQQEGHIVSVLEQFRPSVDGQTLTLDGDSGQGLIYRAVPQNQ